MYRSRISEIMESKSILTCSQFPLVEVDQALVMILSQLSPLSTIRVPLIESCGFVVAESVFSKGIKYEKVLLSSKLRY